MKKTSRDLANEIEDDENWESLGKQFPKSFIFKNENDTIIGKLILKDSVVLKKFKKKTRIFYIIESKQGRFTVWGTGLLDHLMKTVKIGMTIKIVYLGRKAIKGMGKNVSQYLVFKKKKK